MTKAKCKECTQDLTGKAQYYDYKQGAVLVYCCECNYKVGNLKK